MCKLAAPQQLAAADEPRAGTAGTTTIQMERQGSRTQALASACSTLTSCARMTWASSPSTSLCCPSRPTPKTWRQTSACVRRRARSGERAQHSHSFLVTHGTARAQLLVPGLRACPRVPLLTQCCRLASCLCCTAAGSSSRSSCSMCSSTCTVTCWLHCIWLL